MKEGARVMSLTDGTSKMSKSDPVEGSRINLTDSPDVIRKKVRASVLQRCLVLSSCDKPAICKRLLVRGCMVSLESANAVNAKSVCPTQAPCVETRVDM